MITRVLMAMMRIREAPGGGAARASVTWRASGRPACAPRRRAAARMAAPALAVFSDATHFLLQPPGGAACLAVARDSGALAIIRR